MYLNKQVLERVNRELLRQIMICDVNANKSHGFRTFYNFSIIEY